MAIDANLEVKVDGGVVSFEPLGLNEWVAIQKMEEKSLEEQADMLVEKIVAVTGLKYKSGADVTLEDIKAKKFGMSFCLLLKKEWLKAVVASFNGEAAAKNE